MNSVYILLGTNLGDKKANLQNALDSISKICGIVIQKSHLYETTPWGITNQPLFINQVILLETKFPALILLEKLLQIEQELGRIRTEKWGERIIDLDLLFFNKEIIIAPNLKIPHPALHQRLFTLIPLCEIASNFLHPVFNLSCQKLLDKCQDKGSVSKLID